MFRRTYDKAFLNPNSPRTAATTSPSDAPRPPTPEHKSPNGTGPSVCWNNPPISWSTSSAALPAAYDVNPKYTTANNSYTHRCRRSLIPEFLARQNADPYAPQYEDWRTVTASGRGEVKRSDSPRGSFSLNSGITHGNGKWWERAGVRRKRLKACTGILLVVSVIMLGFWIRGGALTGINLRGPDASWLVGWEHGDARLRELGEEKWWHVHKKVCWKNVGDKAWGLNDRIKVPDVLAKYLRASGERGGAGELTIAKKTVLSTSTSTAWVDPDFLWPPETLSTAGTKTTKEVGPAIKLNTLVPPIAVFTESSEEELMMGVEAKASAQAEAEAVRESAGDSDEKSEKHQQTDESQVDGGEILVEEVWRKHNYALPEMIETETRTKGPGRETFLGPPMQARGGGQESKWVGEAAG